MKFIKSCVRTEVVDGVIHALEELGIPCLSVIDVRLVGSDIKGEDQEVSIEYGTSFVKMAKLEMFCRDNEVERVLEVIEEKAHTNRRGDGMAVVMPVDRLMNIHTGEKP